MEMAQLESAPGSELVVVMGSVAEAEALASAVALELASGAA